MNFNLEFIKGVFLVSFCYHGHYGSCKSETLALLFNLYMLKFNGKPPVGPIKDIIDAF